MIAIARKEDSEGQTSPIGTGWTWLAILAAVPVTAAILCVSPEMTGWGRMWLLAVAIYLGCKWLTWIGCGVPSTLSRSLAYWLAWPGLDATAFLSTAPQRDIAPPKASEWFWAGAKMMVGMSLLGMATGLAELPNKLAVGWLGMVGMILLLHFGLFHLLSCWWRSRGVDAPPLMNAPLLARSVSEFWGRRWNGAFRDLTHRFLFRTLAVRIGAAWAVMIGFLFSGLVHDMVISYPAGGGYGWPTAYFLLQGSAILLERSWLGKRASLHRGWQGRAFAAVVLVAPIAWLFHHWFVENIIVPMLLVWKEIG